MEYIYKKIKRIYIRNICTHEQPIKTFLLLIQMGQEKLALETRKSKIFNVLAVLKILRYTFVAH